MRQKFFNLVQDVIYAGHCYEKYYRKVVNIERFVNAFCACASTVGIAGWAIWNTMPFLWSVIIILSQSFAVIFPYTPYHKRRIALEFLIPRMRELKLEVHRIWQLHCDDEEYDFTKEFIQNYEKFHRLDIEFLGAEEIPINRKIQDKADKETKSDLSGSYSVEEGDLLGKEK